MSGAHGAPTCNLMSGAHGAPTCNLMSGAHGARTCDLVDPDTSHRPDGQSSDQRVTVVTVLQQQTQHVQLHKHHSQLTQ